MGNNLSLSPTLVALGLGSNLGDRESYLSLAIGHLVRCGLKDVQISSWYYTEPQDCPSSTPYFLNGVVTGYWEGTCRELFIACQNIEQRLGRPYPHPKNSNRTIDIDILLFGEQIIQESDLQVPHPGLGQRLFVLEPLAELLPHFLVPSLNKTVLELKNTILCVGSI